MLSIFDKVQDIFQKNGVSKQYRNYPYLGFKNWETAYYGDNYPKLQEVKKIYDPTNRLEQKQTIKPAT